MKWAIALVLVAVGVITYQVLRHRDPALPTAPATAGATPMTRAPGEPVEGEPNYHGIPR
ncbi:MAG: hypothetical protein AMXMBFR81_10480 [Chthonomonas sp.]|nr:hypothetical protein [Fimbriimonadaceae bacterium]